MANGLNGVLENVRIEMEITDVTLHDSLDKFAISNKQVLWHQMPGMPAPVRTCVSSRDVHFTVPTPLVLLFTLLFYCYCATHGKLPWDGQGPFRRALTVITQYQ